MALVCAISNEVPEVAVISPVSGCIFERRLIEKYLDDSGNTDPINGQSLTKDMLIEVKTPAFVKARPPTATSIPGLLKSLQDEWDAIMLQSFTMRSQLQVARQEMSHSMYQHDAACRVVARLTKESSAAREALATLKPKQVLYSSATAPPVASAVASSTTEAQVVGVSDEVIKELHEVASQLTAERKRKVVPQDLTTADTIKAFVSTASFAGLHSASTPGITCLDMVGDTIVTGGCDKTVCIFNISSKEVVGIVKGHTKKITKVACHPTESVVISGSADSTIRISPVSNMESTHVLRVHDEAITGISIHPTGNYFLSTSMDRYWAFSDLRTGTVMAKVLGDEQHALTAGKFHPDGLLFAAGTETSVVKIWDLKQQTNVANFTGHTGQITAAVFSENGFYLATAGEDGMVKLWDLRKLKNFKTLELGPEHAINDLDFDNSGTYLALNGQSLRVLNTKTLSEIMVFKDHTNVGTGVRFGPNAASLASTSMDRTLKFYGTPI